MKKSLRLSGFLLCVISLPIVVQAQSVTQQAPFSGQSGNAYSVPAGNVDQSRMPGNVVANPQASGNQGAPQYQYSQHNNPFYDGSTPGGMVSDTIDWIVGLPSNFMDRVSEYLDTRFFPQKPATSGSPATQSGNSGQAQNPLPPASAYNPGGK